MGVYSLRSNEMELNLNIEECSYEPGLEGAMAIVAESEANYNAIMRAVGIEELAVYESTGAEMVYEAGNISSFFGKVKEFFKKILEKIKALFKKFFAMFDSYTKSDKEFLNKYRQVLTRVNTRDFKYKGFKFTHLNIDINDINNKLNTEIEITLEKINNENTKTKLEEMLKNFEDREDKVEKLRSIAVGETSSLTKSEFIKELYMYFRDGENTKQELDDIKILDVLGNLQNNSNLVKTAKKSYSDLEKSLKKIIRDVEKAEKDLSKELPSKTENDGDKVKALKVRACSELIALLKEKTTVLNTLNGANLTALKDCSRQSKAICVALINYKPKNESYDFGYEDDYVAESGFLGNVVLR